MQVLSQGSHTARWGHYVLHVWWVDGGWYGRMHHWPKGGVRKVVAEGPGLADPTPDVEKLLEVMCGRLVALGCKAFVDGEFHSLRKFLVFEAAPVSLGRGE